MAISGLAARPASRAAVRARVDAIRVAVLGRAGKGNLGEEALIASVFDGVRRRYPNATLAAITADPSDTARRYGITTHALGRQRTTVPSAELQVARQETARATATPNKWATRLKAIPPLYRLAKGVQEAWPLLRQASGELRFLRSSYRFARRSDLVIVAGSQQLNDDWGGPWWHPFTMMGWSLAVWAARVPLAFLSVGAGPFRSRLSVWFMKLSVRLAGYCSVRDQESRMCLRAHGVKHDVPVVPDLVFGLRVALPPHASWRPAGARRVVGINTMPAFDSARWTDADQPVYDAYVRTIAEFADWLLQRGYDVAFFATHVRSDPDVGREVRSHMRHRESTRITEPRIDSLEELVDTLATFDAVLTTRYHGALISLLTGKPVVAIAYHPKTQDLMAAVGLSARVVDIRDLSLAALRDRFITLEQEGWRLPEAVQERLAAAQAAVEAQYDRLLELVDEPR